jgi:glycopeptide antibiotics resistance protein
MGSLLPGVIAFVAGTVLAVGALVPWAAREYRRHGRLGFRRGLLAFGTLVYALALVTYTLLPLPTSAAAACRVAAAPQLNPIAFLSDIQREGGITGPRSLVSNPAVTQVLFNVLLFVPLGALVRHAVLRRRVGAGLLAGAGVGFVVSLLIEFTQLTGDWFLYPCAYRLFDVDDLLANTAGALLGTLLAPLVGLLAGSSRASDADEPRPVTAGRRFFGILADVMALSFTSGVLTSGTSLVLALCNVDERSTLTAVLVTVAGFIAPAVQLVIVLASGRTLGEHVIRVRPVPTPGIGSRLVRWALGSGGWMALSASSLPFSGLLATALAVAAVIGVWATRDRRGFASAVARVGVEDDRVRRGVDAPVV